MAQMLQPCLQTLKPCLGPLNVQVPEETVHGDDRREDKVESPQQKKKKKAIPKATRAAISAETGSEVDAVDSTHHVTEKTEAQRELLKSVIDSSTIFQDLGLTDVVVNSMFERNCNPGEHVIVQGDAGDNWYVVEDGEYSIILKQKGHAPVGFYKSGASFGELALMYNTPRAATIQCISGGKLWALDRKTYKSIMVNVQQRNASNTAMFLKSVSFLSTLTDQQRDAVGSVLQEQSYNEGDVIVKQDDRSDALYVIKEGVCQAYVKHKKDLQGKRMAIMKSGAIFGESSLTDEKATRKYTVVADSQATIFKLERKDFVELLGDLKDLVKQNFTLKVLASMEMFKHLSKTQQAILQESLEEMKVKKGEQIVKQGQEGNEFYIIVAGSVRVERVDDQGEYHLIKDKLGVGAYFGEMALLDEKARMASVVANEDCTLQWINKRVFNNLFGSMADTMQREADRRKREIERKSRPPMQHKDLEVMRTLGVGSFGRVRMVKHVPTSMPYALKCMRKGQMIAMRQVDHVRNEKDILAMCDHPFVLNLEATFQDADELYMAFELILGGELFTDISFTELELKSIEAPHKPQIKDPLDADNFDEVDDDSDDSDDEEMVAQLAEWKTHNKDPNLFANF